MNCTLIKKSCVGLLAIILSTSCADLTENLTGQPTVDKFFQTLTDFNSYITGAYTPLILLYGTDMPYAASAGAEDVNTPVIRWKGFEQVNINTVGNPDEVTDELWNSYYTSISACNTLIKIIGENTKLSPDELSPIGGEAHFLRAFNYFQLVRWFGEVPLLTEENQDNAAKEPQASVARIYEQIVSDLKNAELTLPLSQDDPSRPSRWAAKALLAKVYATHYRAGDEKYARAARLCKEVLESESVGNPQSGSDLVAYDKVFDIGNEMNKEIIFAVRYLSGNAGIGSPFGNMFAPVNNGANVIIGTSSGYNTPTDNIIAAYEQRGAGADKRLDVNIAQKYFNTTTQTWVTEGNCRYCKKYVNPVTTQYDGESDWPVIRVADIALLYAELTNEISGPSADNLKYLNMVCERAGVSTYTLTDLPGLYDFRKAVRNERRLELAFENQRWFDLLRWGIATQTVNNYLNSELLYTEYSYTVNDIEDWQTFLPIPVSVIDINPEIAQNTGY